MHDLRAHYAPTLPRSMPPWPGVVWAPMADRLLEIDTDPAAQRMTAVQDKQPPDGTLDGFEACR